MRDSDRIGIGYPENSGNTVPCVSVVMSVYNGEAYLREAIDSILAQSFRDWEFIIVDDGSRDGTNDILDSYQDRRIVRLRHERNLGMGEAYNRALRTARGEFIAMQDADDVSLPERMMTEVTYLREHPDVGVIGTAFYLTNDRGEPLTVIQPAATDTGIRWQMLFITPLCHGSIMYRRELIERHQLFYQASPPVEDYEFLTKLIDRTRAAGLTTPLYLYRRHGNSIRDKLEHKTAQAVSAISKRQIARLLPEQRLDQTDIESLNKCLYPKEVSESDMSLWVTMLGLFAAFERQPGTDIEVVQQLRRDWIKRVLARISAKPWQGMEMLRFLISILRYDSATLAAVVLPELFKRSLSRVHSDTWQWSRK